MPLQPLSSNLQDLPEETSLQPLEGSTSTSLTPLPQETALQVQAPRAEAAPSFEDFAERISRPAQEAGFDLSKPPEHPILERAIRPAVRAGYEDVTKATPKGLDVAASDVLDRGPQALVEWDELAQAMAERIPEDLSFGEQLTYDVVRSLVSNSPALAVGATIGGPVGLTTAITGIGAQVFAQTYGEARSEGLEPEAALAKGAFYAAAEGLPEAIPVGVAIKRGTPFLKRVLSTTFAESVTEPITEALQMGYDAGVLDEETPLKEAVARMGYASLVGGLSGGLMGAGAHAFARGAKPTPEVLGVNAPQAERILSEQNPGESRPEVVHPETGESVPIEMGQEPPGVDVAGVQTPASPSGPNVGVVKENVRSQGDPADGYVPQEELDNGQDNWSWYTGWFENLVQVSARNPDVPGLQEYTEAQRDTQFERSQWSRIADQRVRDWVGLGKAEQQAVGDMLFEVANMEANPTVEEEIALRDKYNLSEDGMLVYESVRQDLSDYLDALESSAQDSINRTLKDEEARTIALINLKMDMSRLRSRPYFPFSRFGRHTAVVKANVDHTTADGRRVRPGGTVFMEAFQSEKQAVKRRKELEREYSGGDFSVFNDYLAEGVEGFRGVPGTLLDLMKNRLGLSDVQQAQLDQIKNEVAPQQSFRKRLLRREKVAGYSTDAVRSYATYMFSGSGHIAKLKYDPAMQAAIQKLVDSAGNIRGGSKVLRRKMIEYVQRHYAYINKPENDWAKARAFGFLFYLGAVPKSAVVNMTQPLVTTYPYLAAKYGDAKAVAAMVRAAKDVPKLLTDPEFIRNLPPDEVQALTWAVNSNVLDESLIHDLAAEKEGGNLVRAMAGSRTERVVRNFNRFAGYLFHNAERIIRRVSFRSGYQLARDNPDNKDVARVRKQYSFAISKLMREHGMSEDVATASIFGREVVEQTMFEYSRWNRARLLQGRRSVLFLFKNFVLSQLWFGRHNPGRWRHYGMLIVLAGMMGLPFMEDLLGLWKKATRDLKKSGVPIPNDAMNPEILVAEMFEEITGFNGDRVLTGVGGDILGADIAGSIGMGRITGLSNLQTPQTADAAIVSTMEELAGPLVGGLGGDVWRAMASDSVDDLQKWMRALTPLALRNVVKAQRMEEMGGVERYPGGPILEGTEDPSFGEILGQSMGFTPSRSSRSWDVDRALRGSVEYWADRRAILFRQWNYAKDIGDREANADMKKAVQRYNKERPKELPGISFPDLQQSRRRHLRVRRLQEMGLTGRSKKGIRFERSMRERLEGVYWEEESSENP